MRQHICLARYMPSPVHLSVHLTVTWVDHLKTVEVSIMQLSPQCSLCGYSLGSLGGGNKLFSSLMSRYLENGMRYDRSYLLLMTNWKLHVHFQLSRSMTLDDLELL